MHTAQMYKYLQLSFGSTICMLYHSYDRSFWMHQLKKCFQTHEKWEDSDHNLIRSFRGIYTHSGKTTIKIAFTSLLKRCLSKKEREQIISFKRDLFQMMMTWCFTSLSVLLVILRWWKDNNQRLCAVKWSVFHLQQDSNPGSHDLQMTAQTTHPPMFSCFPEVGVQKSKQEVTKVFSQVKMAKNLQW